MRLIILAAGERVAAAALRVVRESLYPRRNDSKAMANGYASNIPLENVAAEPELLPESMCIICKKKARTGDDGVCASCTAKLAG